MRKALLFVILCFAMVITFTGCGKESISNPGTGVQQNSRIVTDMAGRNVAMPQTVHKVYPVSPIESILLYTIDPELLIGWSYHMGDDETGFILPAYRKLPVLGWINRGSTGNVEEIIKMQPNLILMVNDINQANKKYADDLQQLTKIPVVLLDKEMTKMDQTYLAAGKILNRENRAAALAAYASDTMKLVEDKKELVKQRKPVTVYYAEGRRGLETEPRGSWHAEIIELVGGVNVAEPGLPSSGPVGRSPVSLEQVLKWNPEVILISFFRDGESSSFPTIIGDASWKSIRAVRDRRVYEIPTGPFNWFDRPPGFNRLIGMRWVANLLYPDIYPFDFRSEVKNFYSLFYHYQLSDKELDELAARAQR